MFQRAKRTEGSVSHVGERAAVLRITEEEKRMRRRKCQGGDGGGRMRKELSRR